MLYLSVSASAFYCAYVCVSVCVLQRCRVWWMDDGGGKLDAALSVPNAITGALNPSSSSSFFARISLLTKSFLSDRYMYIWIKLFF